MPPSSGIPKHVYLIDGSGYIFRAFHALPPLTRSDGTPINAVLGFTTMLIKLLDDTDADHIAVIFDAARKTFRNDIYPEYKAHRTEVPPELIPQFSLIRDATRALNVSCIEMPGYEADDLIATYSKHALAAGADVTIVSSDKDLMQLVGDKVQLFDPVKNRPIGIDQVKEKFGVEPEKVIEVQALIGDSSDNVPGVPGIGPKTAAELITQFGDLETLLSRLAEIKQPKRRESLIANAELARLSRQLVLLKDDIVLEIPLTELARKPWDNKAVQEFLQKNEFRSLLSKMGARLTDTTKPVDLIDVPAATTSAASSSIDRDAYICVQDEATLLDWIQAAGKEGIVAIDTETTSLSTSKAEIVGFSLALSGGRACYVPVAHRNGNDLLSENKPAIKQMDVQKAMALLKPLLQDPSILKVGQNIKYDMAIFAKYGISVAPFDDTMMISYVLEGGAHGHGMDELSELYLGHTPIGFDEVTGTGKQRITFDLVELEKACRYAAEDADITLRLYQVLKPRLMAEHLLAFYETTERPLIGIIARMERDGVKLDAKELQRLSNEFAQRLAILEKEIHELAGMAFNIGSPKQLGEVLFDRLKLGQGAKGKTGSYATGADVLEELASNSHHPLPRKVLDWRQLAKLKSTYTDALLEQIDPHTKRVHTSFALASTSTGRLSSSDPNVQNIPIRTEEGRKIRRAFIAEDGHMLLSADYSQIELRLAAEMAGIDSLKEAFTRGDDIHAITASQVFGVPIEGMDPMVRRKAKAINFGIIYGISAFGLAAQLGIPQGEAKSYIDAYFKRYPGIREYMDRTKKFARDHGYVETLFGRRCHVPGINDKNPARRSFMERAAINAPLQGTAADIIKRAMIRLPDALRRKGLQARMLLQVHDELIFEVPEAEIKETAALVKSVMEQATLPARHLSIPLTVETGVGKNWAEAH